MGVLDGDGNLFGVLNVVDLLVVVLLVGAAVGVATLATAGSGADTERVTRYVDVTFPDEPESVATGLREGPATVRGVDGTVTDVFRGTAGDSLATVARVRFDVSRPGPEGTGPNEVVLDQQVVRSGSRVQVTTDTLEVTGSAVAVGRPGPTFERVNATVVVDATVAPGVGSAVSVGDRHRVGNDTLATVTAVDRAPPGEVTDVTLALTARTPVDRDGLYYGTTPLKLGTEIRFETDAYAFDATVVAVER